MAGGLLDGLVTIYIYYDEVRFCVCVTKHDHFLSAQAEHQRREVRRLLGLAGHRPALA